MKAENLMIEDFVMQNGCTHPSRVAGVTPNKIHTIWADGTKHAKDAYYFEPIPLTAEILEKNGWWYNIEDLWLHDEVDFCIEKWNGRFLCYDINQIKLHSVHELQRALRLCGLNDLADNFKV